MKKLAGIIAAIFLFTSFFESCSSKKTDEFSGGKISGSQNSVTEISESIKSEEPEIETKEEEEIFPKLKNFYMTADNLKIRSEEGVNAETLYVLPKETRVFVTELGTVEEIDGVKAAWTKVVMESCTDLNGKKIEGGAAGWCFGSYLYKKKALAAEEIPAVLKECPHYGNENYDDYEYEFHFEEDNDLFIVKGFAEDVEQQRYKYNVVDGYITIEKNEDYNHAFFYNGTTFNLEYDIDYDGYSIDAGEDYNKKHYSKRRKDSILYDKENDMLFVRCGRFAEGSTKVILEGDDIYSAEESFFHSRPDTSSEKLTYKEYVFPEPDGYKIYNMDRVFAGQKIYVNAKSLYPAFENKYWYATKIDISNPRKAYVLCSEGEAPSYDDLSDYHDEFRKYQMKRVEELASQGVLNIKPLTEEEKQSIIYAKWLPDLYGNLFNETN